MPTIYDSQDLVDNIIMDAIIEKPKDERLLKETLKMLTDKIQYYYENASDEEQGVTFSYTLDMKYFCNTILNTKRDKMMSTDLLMTYLTLSGYLRMRTLYEKFEINSL